MSDSIKFVCKNSDNMKIIEKYIKNYDDPLNALYEIGYLTKVENVSLKDAIGMLKTGKIGKNHSNFEDASRKLLETDNFLNKPFEVQEGAVICGKCNSNRTITHAVCERGDEGLRVYTFCVDCKYRSSSRS